MKNFDINSLNIRHDGKTYKDVFTKGTQKCPKLIRDVAREIDRNTDTTWDLNNWEKKFERDSERARKHQYLAEPFRDAAIGVGIGTGIAWKFFHHQ